MDVETEVSVPASAQALVAPAQSASAQTASVAARRTDQRNKDDRISLNGNLIMLLHLEQ